PHRRIAAVAVAVSDLGELAHDICTRAKGNAYPPSSLVNSRGVGWRPAGGLPRAHPTAGSGVGADDVADRLAEPAREAVLGLARLARRHLDRHDRVGRVGPGAPGM